MVLVDGRAAHPRGERSDVALDLDAFRGAREGDQTVERFHKIDGVSVDDAVVQERDPAETVDRPPIHREFDELILGERRSDREEHDRECGDQAFHAALMSFVCQAIFWARSPTRSIIESTKSKSVPAGTVSGSCCISDCSAAIPVW